MFFLLSAEAVRSLLLLRSKPCRFVELPRIVNEIVRELLSHRRLVYWGNLGLRKVIGISDGTIILSHSETE